jgi:hypothetical protein
VPRGVDGPFRHVPDGLGATGQGTDATPDGLPTLDDLAGREDIPGVLDEFLATRSAREVAGTAPGCAGDVLELRPRTLGKVRQALAIHLKDSIPGISGKVG